MKSISFKTAYLIVLLATVLSLLISCGEGEEDGKQTVQTDAAAVDTFEESAEETVKEQTQTAENEEAATAAETKEESTQGHIHEYSEWSEVISASCTREGTQQRSCACGQVEEQAIPMLAHEYLPADCTHPKTCHVCGFESGAPTGHTFGAWRTLMDATCTQRGLQGRACACGETETIVITQKAHDYQPASCTEPKMCRVCHQKSGDALGHTFGTWKTTRQASCTETGVEERFCHCGEKQTRTIAKKDHTWQDASCELPQTCKNCGITRGAPNGHTFGAWKTTKQASCTQAGLQERFCVCGVKETKPIAMTDHTWTEASCTAPKICQGCQATAGAPLGHDFGAWQTVREATCERVGSQTAECIRCDQVKHRDIEMIPHTWDDPTCQKPKTCLVCHLSLGQGLGHSFGAWRVVEESTCIKQGVRERSCSCGQVEREQIALAEHTFRQATCLAPKTCEVCKKTEGTKDVHRYTAYEVTKQASCKENGILTRSCLVCKQTDRKTIDKTDHVYRDADCTHPATCTECGKTTGTALGHTFGAWQTVRIATCTAEGQRKRSCHCLASEVEAIAKVPHNYKEATCTRPATCVDCGAESGVALGHTYGQWETVKPATCSDEGQRKRSCHCSASEVEAIAKIPHNYEEATCTRPATCKSCSETIGVALGHTFGAWQIVTPPSCTEEGMRSRGCACGYTQTETLAKTEHQYHENTCTLPATCRDCGYTKGAASGHSFGDWVSEIYPTCTQEGRKIRTCSACGEKESQVIPKINHPFAPASCTAPKTCLVCGYQEGEVLNHAYGEWHLIKASTCTAEGVEERTCLCGSKDTRSVAKKAHIDGEWLIDSAPTLTKDGKRSCFCAACRQLIRIESIEAGASEGFEILCNDENMTCLISGLGSCTDRYIVIPTKIGRYTVSGINPGVFTGNKSIVSVTVGRNIKEIVENSFASCTSLQAVCLENGVTRILDQAFYQCASLRLVTIPPSVTRIGTAAFAECKSLTSLTLPSKLSAIENGVFSHCTSLTQITIPSSVSTIGKQAFFQCTALSQVTVGSGVETIGVGAFAKCTMLKEMMLPDALNRLCTDAFLDCSSLIEVRMGSGLRVVEAGAFSGCTALLVVSVSEANEKFVCVSNCLIEKENGVLVAGFPGCVIPTDGSVKAIGDYAFYHCNDIVSVIIPDSVTRIGQGAFESCRDLESVVILGSVGVLPESVFSDCHALKTVVIGAGIHKIEDYAFVFCTSLEEIVIPDGVTSIGSWAFYKCSAIKRIVLPDSLKRIGVQAFYHLTSLETMEYFGSAEQWDAVEKGENWDEQSAYALILQEEQEEMTE